ncbi:S1 family peptidase [Veronia pacifica]|uniref:Peptidase S1 domain-containing protein n=1 Tax=Veronia pacifica TaxID=1080227 RepID=A0A1C3EDV0_9GAMM|nr:serine protease [Veronia pacifica]ODA31384.1 hypothetical protein A8L45_17035 [Veronia pacifica]
MKKLSIIMGMVALGHCMPIMADTDLQRQLKDPLSSLENLKPRIIGGEPAKRENWPFMVALVGRGQSAHPGQFCGGSLIGDRYVLTAAHCVDGSAAEDIEVVVGIYDLTQETSQGERVNVSLILSHQDYRHTHGNDIAVLVLEDALNQDIVALADIENKSGDSLNVAGWGNLNSDGTVNSPAILHQVDVDYVSRELCKQSGGDYSNVNETEICAGFEQGGKDSCQGDSGGPLIFNDNGVVKQVGVVSWGAGCAQPDNYGVYANVAYYAENGWIKEQTNGVYLKSPNYVWSYEGNERVNTSLQVLNFTEGHARVLDLEIDNDNTAEWFGCHHVQETSPIEKCDVSLSLASWPEGEKRQVVVNLEHDDVGLKSIQLELELDRLARDLGELSGAIGRSVYVNDNAWQYSDGAFESVAIGNSSSSIMQIAELEQGKISFEASVSSELGYDFLRVVVNGEVKLTLSGQESFNAYELELPNTVNSVTFIYEKDNVYFDGKDKAYIQRLKFEPDVIVNPEPEPIATSGGAFGIIMGFMALFLMSFKTSRKEP